jgi:hypothetical protein
MKKKHLHPDSAHIADDGQDDNVQEEVVMVHPEVAQRKLRYIGKPCNVLYLPNLSGSFNPHTIDEATLRAYINRYPTLSKLFSAD